MEKGRKVTPSAMVRGETLVFFFNARRCLTFQGLSANATIRIRRPLASPELITKPLNGCRFRRDSESRTAEQLSCNRSR
jgi:hypothetical protein